MTNSQYPDIPFEEPPRNAGDDDQIRHVAVGGTNDVFEEPPRNAGDDDAISQLETLLRVCASKNRPATQGRMTSANVVSFSDHDIPFEEPPRNAGDDDIFPTVLSAGVLLDFEEPPRNAGDDGRRCPRICFPAGGE